MKKCLALLLAIVFLMATASATTVASPLLSKTSEALTVVSAPTTEDGTVIEGFAITPVEPSEAVLKEFTKLYEEVVVNGIPPIQCFPPEVQTAVVELLPEEVKPEDFEINEFLSIRPEGYQDEFGTVKAKFSFATQYQPDQSVIAMFALYSGVLDAEGNDVAEWIPMPATVTDDGGIELLISAEDMTKIDSAQDVALAVMSERLTQE